MLCEQLKIQGAQYYIYLIGVSKYRARMLYFYLAPFPLGSGSIMLEKIVKPMEGHNIWPIQASS